MTIINTTRKLAMIVCAGAILVVGVIPFAGGLIGQYQREARIAAKGEIIAAQGSEAIFKNVCPNYRDASMIAKWTTYRDLAWCEDYLDRL